MINRIAPEEMARRHRAFHERLNGEGPRPRVRNLRPVLWLTDPFRVPYRGRLWEIPPVSFEDGARVLEFMDWIEHGEEDPDAFVAEYRPRMRRIVRLIRKLVRPYRGRLARIRWRLGLMRNPWRSASLEDLGELLGFFWGRRMTSLDRRPSPLEEVGGSRISSMNGMSLN